MILGALTGRDARSTDRPYASRTAMTEGPASGNDGGHGSWHGLPYDVRPPTVARHRLRYWNPDDPRLFTPKVFGAGWTVNAYWLVHLVRYVRRRGTGRPQT